MRDSGALTESMVSSVWCNRGVPVIFFLKVTYNK